MKLTALAFSALLFLALALASVQARPFHAHHSWDGEEPLHGRGGIAKLMARLDLSEDQKRDLAAILKEHRKELGTLATDLAKSRKAIRDSVLADDSSDAAIHEAVQEAALKGEQLAVLVAQIVREVRTKKVLSPEQMERLLALGEKRALKMTRFVESRLAHLDEWIEAHSD
jgi:Spy/CpxP family protein refolding chaperone